VAFGFVFENALSEKVRRVSVWFQCRVVFLKARHLDAHTCIRVCICDSTAWYYARTRRCVAYTSWCVGMWTLDEAVARAAADLCVVPLSPVLGGAEEVGRRQCVDVTSVLGRASVL